MPPSPEQVAALLSKRDATIRRVIGERDALRKALEPFALDVGAISLSRALGHISREHLLAAKAALAAVTRPDAGGAA